MELNNKYDLDRMEFSDDDVLECELNKDNKKIEFILSGARGKGMYFGPGYFKLENYNNIKILSFDGSLESMKILSEDTYEKLRSICEIEISPDSIVIKGYAVRTSHWIEFYITGGKVSGFFSDEVDD